MSTLSDTQLVILSTACQHPDRLLLPLPERFKGGAAANIVRSLTAKGLIEEVAAKRGQPVWRKTDDGRDITLVVTDAAFAALGIELEGKPPKNAETAPTTKKAKSRSGGKKREPGKAPRAPRTDTKQAQLITMLERAKGASIEEISEALGWQHHTFRGAIAGALKRKLGLDVVTEKTDKRGRIYRIKA